jgi:type I restriction enzyme, S subunit
MTQWRELKLGDVLELKRGYDLPRGNRGDGSVPVISSSGPTGFHSEAKVHGPGVVTGRYGTLGHAYYIAEDFWPLNTTLYVRDFKGNNPRYVAALLESMQLAQYDGASAVPGLNRNQLHTLRVRVPNHVGQAGIAAVLGALDSLIANLRRRVEVLEEIARAIYWEWFVKFRFPGHANAKFVDSNLGRIPSDWSITTLGDSARWLSGGTPSTTKKEYWGGGIPWITGGSLTSLLLDRSDRTLTEAGAANGTRIVDRDALLFVVRGMSLVKEFRVGIADTRLAFGQDVKALVAVDGIDPIFLAFSVITRADEIQRMVELAGHGTGKLSTDRLKAVQIIRPPIDVQARFAREVQSHRELMTTLRLVTDRLVGMRDELLPKLVSGQIEMSSLELDAVLPDSVV